jgi:hypothetical protein
MKLFMNSTLTARPVVDSNEKMARQRIKLLECKDQLMMS